MTAPYATLAGADGCRGGWVVVALTGGVPSAHVVPDIATLATALPGRALVAIDIPIGLPQQEPRACEAAARRLLGRPRGSSVFPVPLRACLAAATHAEASRISRALAGRGVTVQAWSILPKIREVDAFVRGGAAALELAEVHPEVSFACWNAGQALRHRKLTAAGRAEREALIDAAWPGVRARLWPSVAGACQRDDFNDAFAALWSARRIAAGTALVLPAVAQRDGTGTPMRISA